MDSISVGSAVMRRGSAAGRRTSAAALASLAPPSCDSIRMAAARMARMELTHEAVVLELRRDARRTMWCLEAAPIDRHSRGEAAAITCCDERAQRAVEPETLADLRLEEAAQCARAAPTWADARLRPEDGGHRGCASMVAVSRSGGRASRAARATHSATGEVRIDPRGQRGLRARRRQPVVATEGDQLRLEPVPAAELRCGERAREDGPNAHGPRDDPPT